MKYEIWVIGEETEHVITLYDCNDVFNFLSDNDYKIYTAYHASYDRMIFEVK